MICGWILGNFELEATRNVSAIKRAYAQKTRICHPEKDPEGFLERRKARQDGGQFMMAWLQDGKELVDEKA